MLFNSFSDLVAWSKAYANEISTMVENRFYDEYGWGCVTFETDKFGGCYIQLKYFPGEKLIADAFSFVKEPKSLSELKVLILNEKAKLESKRNLKEISELINAEY